VAFSPVGRTLAASDGDGNIFLWNITTGKVVTLTDPGNEGIV
jgi:WD40 repeat protein